MSPPPHHLRFLTRLAYPDRTRLRAFPRRTLRHRSLRRQLHTNRRQDSAPPPSHRDGREKRAGRIVGRGGHTLPLCRGRRRGSESPTPAQSARENLLPRTRALSTCTHHGMPTRPRHPRHTRTLPIPRPPAAVLLLHGMYHRTTRSRKVLHTQTHQPPPHTHQRTRRGGAAERARLQRRPPSSQKQQAAAREPAPMPA